jgi:origin recognition complex subunit 1
MERINFPPYTRDQLIEIAQSRLIPHPNPPPSPPNAPPLSEEERKKEATEHQVIESEALMLAAARTTGVTGDARRMLDVCR